MTVDRELPPGAEPTQEGASGRAGFSPRPTSWSDLSEGTVPVMDDFERVEAEEREARWRVITRRPPKPGASRE